MSDPIVDPIHEDEDADVLLEGDGQFIDEPDEDEVVK